MSQTLLYIMLHYITPDMRDWDERVSHITWCVNNAKQETTKLSPYEILYGHPPLDAFDHAFGFEGFSIEYRVNSHMENIRKWVNEAHERAKVRLKKQHDQSAIYYNDKHREVIFNNGDLVLLETLLEQSDEGDAEQLAGLTTKLLFKYSGHWKVNEKVSPFSYRISLLPIKQRSNF